MKHQAVASRADRVKFAQMTNHTSTANEPIDQSDDFLRGLIHRDFQNLSTKYQSGGPRYPAEHIDYIDSDRTRWKAALTQLQSDTLPSLHALIHSLLTLLDPAKLRTADTSTLARVLEIQSALDVNMGHLKSFAARIRHLTMFPVSPSHDEHLRIAFPCQQVLSQAHSLIRKLWSMFHYCFNITREFKLPQGIDYRVTGRPMIIAGRSVTPESALELVAHMIKWLAGNELSKIRHGWEDKLSDLDSRLDQFIQLVIPTAPHAPHHDQLGAEFLEEDVSRVAELTVPVATLARIFHRKLARNLFNQIPCQSSNQMANSHQLHMLANSPQITFGHLGDIFEVCHFGEGSPIQTIANKLLKSIADMRDHFHCTILTITFYIMPLLENSDYKDYINTWLASWYELFGNITQRFIHAIYSLSPPPIEPVQ